MRAGIVERHHRLRTIAVDHRDDPAVYALDRLRPADAGEPPGPPRAGAFERMQQPTRPMNKLLGAVCNLVADHSFGIGQRPRAAHLDDAAVGNRHREAAGVRAIEGADAESLRYRHDQLRVGGIARSGPVRRAGLWLSRRTRQPKSAISIVLIEARSMSIRA